MCNMPKCQHCTFQQGLGVVINVTASHRQVGWKNERCFFLFSLGLTLHIPTNTWSSSMDGHTASAEITERKHFYCSIMSNLHILSSMRGVLCVNITAVIQHYSNVYSHPFNICLFTCFNCACE